MRSTFELCLEEPAGAPDPVNFLFEKEEYPRPLHLVDAYGHFINY